MDFSIFAEGSTWIALFTLTLLEIVLGIDNIIFISIVSNKLPEDQQAKARNIGLGLALIFRVGLLLGITWIIGLIEPVILQEIFGYQLALSWRDLILLAGGLFLLAKSTSEIHHKMEGIEEDSGDSKAKVSLASVIGQIILLDMVFSFDSILTAIGLVEHVLVMIIAVIISIGVMVAFAGKISEFINKHPTLQILALSFLILIGVMLTAEAFHQHVPKGYLYFAVAFSLGVEVVNMRMRKNKKAKPVELKQRFK